MCIRVFHCFSLALLLLVSSSGIAHAQNTAPPIGSWHGTFNDGSGTFTLYCQANGNVMVQVSGTPAVTGRYTWEPTSRGGILTVHYQRVGFQNRLYYSITYVNERSLILSDPFFQVTLYRR